MLSIRQLAISNKYIDNIFPLLFWPTVTVTHRQEIFVLRLTSYLLLTAVFRWFRFACTQIQNWLLLIISVNRILKTCFEWSITIQSTGMNDKYITFCEQIIDKYPWSFYWGGVGEGYGLTFQIGQIDCYMAPSLAYCRCKVISNKTPHQCHRESFRKVQKTVIKTILPYVCSLLQFLPDDLRQYQIKIQWSICLKFYCFWNVFSTSPGQNWTLWQPITRANHHVQRTWYTSIWT